MENLLGHLPQAYKGFHMRPSDNYCIISNDNWRKALVIMKKESLKKLELNPNFLEVNKNDNLSFLKEFSFVEGLNVITPNLNSSFPICEFLNLNELLLECNENLPVDFSNFKNLRICSLDWQNKGSETINSSIDLEILSIYNYDSYNLCLISSLNKLRELKIIDSKLISLDCLDKMDCLKQINIFFCKNLKNIEPIGKLQQLEKITFQGCKNISSIESLSELKNLKTLFYINNGKIETLENLYPLINLEQIDLFDTEILDGKLHVLEYLYKNHKLKKINFKNKKYYSHTREQLGFKAFKLT